MEMDTLNLMQTCRICNCVASQMRFLFEGYENAHQSPRIDEMLMACASVQVMWGDGLPAQICQICMEQLRNAFIFKRQVERTDANLREYAKNIKLDEIKREPQNPDFVEPMNHLNEPAEENNQEPFGCSVIPKIDTDYIQFLDNDQILLTCHECSKIFSTINALRCHKRVHTEKRYKCSQCYKRYTRLNQLQRHEELHTQKKVYVCKICSKAVLRKEHLKRHLMTHLQEKSFSYNICNDNQTEVPTIENMNDIEEQYYQVDRDFDVVFSDYSDVDEPKVQVAERMDYNKVKEVVDMGSNSKENNISEISIVAGNNNNQCSSTEKVTECELKEVKVEDNLIVESNILKDGYDSVNIGLDNNEIDGLQEVKEEDSMDTEDNITEDEDKTTNIERDDGDSSTGTTDSEYLPKRNLSLKLKLRRGRPRKNPLNSPKIKESSMARGQSEFEYETKDREIPCPVCHEIFSSMRALDKHVTVKHKGLKLYKCHACNKQFTTTSNLNKHLSSHSNDRTYCCHVCSKSFKTRHILSEHQKLHETIKGFACDICHQILSCEESLTNHKTSKHGIEAKDDECSPCPRRFATGSYPDVQAKKHNRQKKYQCSECEETFLSKNYLKRHKQGNRDCAKKFLCPECGRRFLRKDYFITHMRRHRGEKPFKCKYCEKCFTRLVDVQVHERYHTGEKTHLCTICGKGFARAYNLTVHVRTHTGEKPHQCIYCEAAFAQRNDLNVHIRRHTGERFQCELCGKGFLMPYLLNQHKRTVHGLNVIGKTRGVSKQDSLDEVSLKSVVPESAVSDMMHTNMLQLN